jgi:L-cysteine desulfidase
MLAMENETVSSVEGIIDEDIEKCIRNMANIGLKGMAATDDLVLDIMTRK